jgi:ADP-ribose pyrophosphatase
MELKRLAREMLYHGRIFDLIVDQVEYPSGTRSVREVAHHPGGAVAIPVFEDGSVLLVRQLRYPLGKHIYELPAGKLAPGEPPPLAAARELEEETGWVAGEVEQLTSVYTTPGFCDEVLHIFLATRLRESPEGHRREEGEFSMTVHRVLLSEAIAMIAAGEIQDAKTIIGLLMVERRMRRPP